MYEKANIGCLCPVIWLWLMSACFTPCQLGASQVIGALHDSASGQPLPNVTVVVVGHKARTITDQYGHFGLTLKPGRYTVEMHAIGYDVARQTVRLMAGKPFRLNVGLNARPFVLKNTVITATGRSKSVTDATVPVEIIDREAIELSNAENVAMLLEDVAGLNVHSSLYGYLGSPTGVMIQGIDPNRLLILIDGQRVIGGPGGIIDLSKLPVASVERVEVVKGPHSALYGSDAMGGVVHIITRHPEQSYTGDVLVRLGTGGLNLLQGDAFLQHSGLKVMVIASRSNQDAVDRSPQDPDTHVDEYDQRFVHGKIHFMMPFEIAISGSLRWLSENEKGISSQYFAPLDKTYIWHFPDRTRRVDLGVRATRTKDEKNLVEVDFSSNYFKKNSVEELVGGRDLRDRFTDSILTKYRMRSVRQFSTAHVVTSGLEYTREELEILLDRTKPLGKQTRTVEVPASQIETAESYVQYEWQVSEKAGVVLGARVQRHSSYGYNLAPKISLSHRLAPQFRLRVAFGQGYRAPSLKELYFVFDHSNLGYKVIGSPSLQPESSWGLNAGFEYRPTSKFDLRVNFFDNRLQNLIQTVFDADQSTGSVAIYSYGNVSRAITRGIEVGVSTQLKSRFGLKVGYTYLKAREHMAKHDLVGRPRHAVRLRANLALLQNRRVELRLRRDSPVWADADGTLRSPATIEVDINYQQPLGRRLMLKCGIENVLDNHRALDQPGDLRSLRGRALRGSIGLRL
jgi:outer membrane receptor for ferrienterochelin and colicins